MDEMIEYAVTYHDISLSGSNDYLYEVSGVSPGDAYQACNTNINGDAAENRRPYTAPREYSTERIPPLPSSNAPTQSPLPSTKSVDSPPPREPPPPSKSSPSKKKKKKESGPKKKKISQVVIVTSYHPHYPSQNSRSKSLKSELPTIPGAFGPVEISRASREISEYLPARLH